MEKQKEEEKRLSKEKNGWRGEERLVEPTCTHVIHYCSFHTYKFCLHVTATCLVSCTTC